MDIRQMALQMIAGAPQLKGNPNAQSMIQAIQSGDSTRGEQIARNLCNTYGTTPQEAFDKAKRFFNL